jgi:pimeloyl-ACP methyl ester carboxylesterase
VPDLVALLERVLAKLDAEPMSVPLDDPKSGKRVEVPVGSWGLRMILLRDLGDASDLPVFPRLLWSIDQGDGSVLSWFVRKRAPGALRANGMGALVDGASGATPGRLALIRDQAERSLFGRAVNFPFPQVNEVWKPLDLGDAYRAPLVSSVRTLLLSGSLDWNCPPQQAEEIRWGFANATHLIVENAGHEQILPHPDVQRAVLRFLRGEDVSGTRAAWPKMKFVPLEGADPQATHPSVQGG